MPFHDTETANHILENWTYANAAARTAATGFVAGDVGKIAYQTDTGSYWRLTATTPTWAALGQGASHSGDTITPAVVTPGALNLPTATSPAQTTEGQAVWDSDDDKLTVGTGSGRKTLVNSDDSRLADSRAPNGSAGGDLTGTYPNPTLGTSGVAAATYGDSTHVAQVTLDAKGRATSASNVAIAVSGPVELLDATTLGVAAASWAVSAIAGTGHELEIFFDVRHNSTGAHTCWLRFNTVATANYELELAQASSGTMGVAEQLGQTHIFLGNVPGASDPAGSSLSGRILIPNYAGANFLKRAQFQTEEYYPGGIYSAYTGFGALTTLTAAVTDVTILTSSGNFAAGSHFTLYRRN